MLQSKLKVHKLQLVKRTHSYQLLILPSSNCHMRHSSLKRLRHFLKVFYCFCWCDSFSCPLVNM